jgi:hypothetical protein
MEIVNKMKAAFVEGISEALPEPYKENAKAGARTLGGKLANSVIDYVAETTEGATTSILVVTPTGTRTFNIVSGLIMNNNAGLTANIRINIMPTGTKTLKIVNGKIMQILN